MSKEGSNSSLGVTQPICTCLWARSLALMLIRMPCSYSVTPNPRHGQAKT